jgi:hypothetical protein
MTPPCRQLGAAVSDIANLLLATLICREYTASVMLIQYFKIASKNEIILQVLDFKGVYEMRFSADWSRGEINL